MLPRRRLAAAIVAATCLTGVPAGSAGPKLEGPLNVAPPAIAGMPLVGQVLTGTNGTWTANGIKYSTTWLRCDSGGTTCAAIDAATRADYLVTSRDAGSTLRFSVVATNRVASAAAVSAATVPVGTPTSDTQPPSPPSDLGIAAMTTTSVTLSWTAATDNVEVAGYDVYVNGNRAGSTSSTSFQAAEPCGTAYTFEVVAFDAAGNRSTSASLTGSTAPCADTQAPTAPNGLNASGVTSASLTLSWSPSTDNVGVKGYDVFIDGVKTGESTSASYTASGLQCAHSYGFAVDAYDAAGNTSPKSATLTVTTAGCSTTWGPGSLIPPNGALLGIYPKPRSGRTHLQELQYLESEAGTHFAIDHDYIHLDTTFPKSSHLSSISSGHTLLVNIKPEINNTPVRWSAIAAGTYDNYLVSKANAFKSLGVAAFVIFHHEPENDLTAFGSTADYVAAWRHVVSVFRDHGATNVAFVWTMMAWTFNGNSNPTAYYPGDDVVDWLAADGYSWYPTKANAPWRSFGEIFGGFTSWAGANHPAKPLMVAETGVQEDPADPTRKGAWYANAVTTMKSWPQIKAFVYFNSDTDGAWWLDSSLAAKAGYAAAAGDTYFRH
jgi:chitodextrinase